MIPPFDPYGPSMGEMARQRQAGLDSLVEYKRSYMRYLEAKNAIDAREAPDYFGDTLLLLTEDETP